MVSLPASAQGWGRRCSGRLWPERVGGQASARLTPSPGRGPWESAAPPGVCGPTLRRRQGSRFLPFE